MSTLTVLKLSGGTAEQEFEELFRKYKQVVYRAAYGVSGNHHDSEDVLQTVFLKLWRRELKPDLSKNTAGYLYRAGSNEGVELQRAKERRRIDEEAKYLEIPAPEGAPGLDEGIRRKLLRVLGRLKPHLRNVFMLHYEEGYSDDEIAKMFGQSRTRVAMTLNRARKQVKRMMHPLGVTP